MADALVALIALVLGLLFLSSALGLNAGFERLHSFSRMRSRYGGIGMRVIYLVLAALMLALSAAIWFDWRLLS